MTPRIVDNDTATFSGGENILQVADAYSRNRATTLSAVVRDTGVQGLVAAALTLIQPADSPSTSWSSQGILRDNNRATAGLMIRPRASYNFAQSVVEHLTYLQEVSQGDEPAITPQTASLARRTWLQAWEASLFKLPVPAACTEPDGKLLYTWDRGDHHFEVEFIPGKPTELFYRNRSSGELWSDDLAIDANLPQAAIVKMRLFA